MPIRPVRTVLATEQEIAAICEKAREQIFAKVLDHYNRHPGSAWSGHYLVDLEKTVKALYKQMGVDIGGAFRDGLPKTMREFYDRAAKDMVKMGRRNAMLGAPDTDRVNYFLNSSFEQVAMRTTKMSFDHIRQLRSVSAEVLRTASLTGQTRAQVTRELLARASEIPGFKFTDNGGREWKDEAYFRMLARTELMNAGRAAYDDKCAAEGCDVMMLDYSGNCCEACAKWEGQLFSLTGATPGLPTKADLEAEGVFHPNCTHSYSAVPDYVRENDFNPDGSPKQPEPEEAKPEPEAKPASEPVKPEPVSEYEKAKREFGEANRAAVDKAMEDPILKDEAKQRGREQADRLGLSGKDKKDFVADFEKQYMEDQRRKLDEVARKVTEEYTQNAAGYGPPPRLVFDGKDEISFMTGDDKELHICICGTPSFVEHCQSDQTIRHEFEHWLHAAAVKKNPELIPEIRQAASDDWQRMLGSYKKAGAVDRLKGSNCADLFAKHIYQREYYQLTVPERRAVDAVSDSIGSIAGSHTYGYGHPDYTGRKGRQMQQVFGSRDYYKVQNTHGLAYGEAIANVKALRGTVPDDILKGMFPKIFEIVVKLEGK